MINVNLREKRFLKNFFMILFVLIAIITITISIVYQINTHALEQEIINLYQNTASSQLSYLDETLSNANLTASRLIVDNQIQLFFTSYTPNILVSGYYSIIASKLNSHINTYIDSIVLYAPQYNRMYDTSIQPPKNIYSLDDPDALPDSVDISWYDTANSLDAKETVFILRAKNDNWPYYLSIVKKWTSANCEGVVIVNIDLIELYDQISANQDEAMQIFTVDQDARVILQKDKHALSVPVSQVEELSSWQPKTNLSILKHFGNSSYAYAQAYSDKYGITYVVYTPVNMYYTNIVKVRNKIALGSALACLAALLVAGLYSIKLVKPLQDIQNILLNPTVFNEQTSNQYDKDIRDIADQIISHLQTNNRLRRELDARLALLKNSQLQALQSQINPHFLFNTLNAISLVVETDCGDQHPGVQMLNELSYVLRYSLSGTNCVPLQEEMEFLKKYIMIMQHRYGHMSVNIQVEPSLYRFAIPKLVLQPLVENSVYHGLSSCEGIRSPILNITASQIMHLYSTGQTLPSVCIEIEDNGMGIQPERLEQLRKNIADYSKINDEHIGIANVSHRFYLMFQKNQELQIESTMGQGTIVRLIFSTRKLDSLDTTDT